MALDGLLHCVACGHKIEPFGDHHCDPKFEKRREAIDRRAQEHQFHRFTEAQRLNYGLYLMTLPGA